MIDNLYQKERKYVRNTEKDNFLNFRSPIFELQKFHNLKAPLFLDSVDEIFSEVGSPGRKSPGVASKTGNTVSK